MQKVSEEEQIKESAIKELEQRELSQSTIRPEQPSTLTWHCCINNIKTEFTTTTLLSRNKMPLEYLVLKLLIKSRCYNFNYREEFNTWLI